MAASEYGLFKQSINVADSARNLQMNSYIYLMG